MASRAVAVSLNNADASVLFAGAAPGLAGMMQVNVQIDAGASSGSAPLVVQIGSSSLPPVNVFVQ